MHFTRFVIAASLAASSLAVTVHARAEESAEEPSAAEALPPEPARHRTVAPHDISLTFSPIHLLLPFAQVTGEFRASDNIGLAVVGGYGKVDVSTTIQTGDAPITSSTSVSIWELAGRTNFYVLGSFDRGMLLGAQLEYIGGSTSNGAYQGGAAAQGLSLGGYVGYKIVARDGFTFEGALGVQQVWLSASSNDGTASSSNTKVLPLGIVDIGWSF
jgi:hypothetical protein